MVFRSEAGRSAQGLLGGRAPRVSALGRAALKWATLDAQDRVLDLSCGGGELLTRLISRMDIHACGLSQSAEQARGVRARMENAEIIYGRMEDIPWHDGVFDAVLLAAPVQTDRWIATLKESLRVLRAGGQMVIARPLSKSLHMPSNREAMTRKELMRKMQEIGFTDITWRISGLNAVIIGWKRNGMTI